MRVLIYGECSDVGSGAWCYYQTFTEMGHDTFWYDRHTSVGVFYHSLIFKILRRLNNRLPFKRHIKNHNKGLLAMVNEKKPDIVIVLKGLLVYESTIQEIKKNGAWVVNINHDDFFTNNPNNTTTILKNAIPAYDHILTTREVNVKELERFNSKVTFFPFAYYPAIHKRVEYSKEDEREWQSDVVFVGTWDKLRESTLEQLVKAVPAEYAIYGGQWDKMTSTVLSPYVHTRLLRGEEMAKAFRYSKVCIGFLSKENRDDYTQRSFEIPASGGLFLAERTLRHQSLYEENNEAVFFDYDNVEELKQKVNYLLSNPEERELIKERGYERVRSSGHTYKDRIMQLLKIYERETCDE